MEVNEEIAVGIARKLALWHTKTFRPILCHEELEPIMSNLGFVGLPPSMDCWREYRFEGKTTTMSMCGDEPLVRLPYPRIDGLHVSTYKAFCDAVAMYLGSGDIADHFHVRGVPLHPIKDGPLEQYRRLYEDGGQYVYRDGSIDPYPCVSWIRGTALQKALEGNVNVREAAVAHHFNINSSTSFQ
ncbi:hypothetical protein KI387_024269, partial [Taxus chinensis]